MHKLVSMSDDDRERLVDEFWNETSDGLDVHPDFVERLRRTRPNLPEEPTTEQLEAWIKLADLLLDDEFRHSVREYLHDRYSTAPGRLMSSPRVLSSIDRGTPIFEESQAACQAGLPVDSPQAQDIADRYAAWAAGLSGKPDTPEHRRRVAANLLVARNSHRTALQRIGQGGFPFASAHGRYLTLVAVINMGRCRMNRRLPRCPTTGRIRRTRRRPPPDRDAGAQRRRLPVRPLLR
jgi:hypothetical protein